MIDTIERFATTYQHTVTLLAVVGTFSAVLVSLALALLAARSGRTRLKATADLVSIAHDKADRKNPPSFLTVRITNCGNMPLRVPVSFFSWKAPLKCEYMSIVPPVDFNPSGRWIGQKRYPVEIAPRASETFYLSDEATLWSEAKRMKATFLDGLRFWFIRAWVRTDDGIMFRVKLPKSVRDVWRHAR